MELSKLLCLSHVLYVLNLREPAKVFTVIITQVPSVGYPRSVTTLRRHLVSPATDALLRANNELAVPILPFGTLF